MIRVEFFFNIFRQLYRQWQFIMPYLSNFYHVSLKQQVQLSALNNSGLHSPMLIPLACKYSEVMNWDTREDLPTPLDPNITTLNGGVIPGQLAQLDSREDGSDGTALMVPPTELQPPPDSTFPVPQTVTCSVLKNRKNQNLIRNYVWSKEKKLK